MYCASTFVTILLIGFLITVIYIIRSTIKIPKGPYTWISNMCTLTLFLCVALCLILGLVYLSPGDLLDEAITQKHSAEEESSYLSTFISKYAMYPLLIVEMVTYVMMSSRLLWIWYSHKELNTIVNKLIFIQRIFGIIHCIGIIVDYGIRLYGPTSFSFISVDNYCGCWIMFYKSLFYATMGAYFAMAVIRLLCVAYPIEYHNR